MFDTGASVSKIGAPVFGESDGAGVGDIDISTGASLSFALKLGSRESDTFMYGDGVGIML